MGSGGGIDGDSVLEETLAQIDENTVVIPGHGPVTDMRGGRPSHLRAVRDRIQRMIDEGKNLEDITAAAPTADFDAIYGPESASLGFVNRVYTDLTK